MDRAMTNWRPPDKDRTLGLDQSYRPLHIRDIVVGGIPGMQSIWVLTDEHRAEIAAGGFVVLNILGQAHPAVLLDTTPKD